MKINVKNILPIPLRNEVFNSQSVYNSDFEIASQNKYLLLSNSGKGKSTFISILYGMRSDFDGDVIQDGASTKMFNIDEWNEIRKFKLSIVFQDLKLFEEHSVFENLIVKNSLTAHKTEKEIEQMLSHLGIDKLKDRQIKTLSLGQQQRVAILRSLLQPFEFLLMDEPFSHLDRDNSKKALELISKECDKNGSGFLITSLGENYEMNDVIKLVI